MNVATALVRAGEYVAADGDHMTGRITGDHWFGFWAHRLDGVSVGHYATLEAAAEVLALEFKLHYGEEAGA